MSTVQTEPFVVLDVDIVLCAYCWEDRCDCDPFDSDYSRKYADLSARSQQPCNDCGTIPTWPENESYT